MVTAMLRFNCSSTISAYLRPLYVIFGSAELAIAWIEVFWRHYLFERIDSPRCTKLFRVRLRLNLDQPHSPTRFS
jgi:hypothetical protein